MLFHLSYYRESHVTLFGAFDFCLHLHSHQKLLQSRTWLSHSLSFSSTVRALCAHSALHALPVITCAFVEDLLELCFSLLRLNSILNSWKLEHAISFVCIVHSALSWMVQNKRREHTFRNHIDRTSFYVTVVSYSVLPSWCYYFRTLFLFIYFHIISFFISNLWNLLET